MKNIKRALTVLALLFCKPFFSYAFTFGSADTGPSGRNGIVRAASAGREILAPVNDNASGAILLTQGTSCSAVSGTTAGANQGVFGRYGNIGQYYYLCIQIL